MPFAIGGNQLDTTFAISNSLRFNRGDSPNLEKTFSGTPTSTRICTISWWMKLADPNDTNGKAIFSAIKSGVNEDVIKFMGINNGILNSLEFAFNNGSDGTFMLSVGSTQMIKFRDPSAWYNICVAIDTTQSNAANRVKTYINGQQVEHEARVEGGSITSDVPMTQNYELGFLTASKHQIGENTDGSGEHFDGYLSEFYFVDGQQLAPTTFSERNDNGVWVPKDAKDDITFGNYGFFLEFKQTGTSADASGMGADTSGNDNHFSASGLAAVDVTTDTPSNNFAVFNPLIAHLTAGGNATRPTYSEGNTKTVTQNSGKLAGSSTFMVSSGKWYAEFKFVATNNAGSTITSAIGITDSPQRLANQFGKPGERSDGVAYINTGSKLIGDSQTSFGNSYTTGDIIGVALDLDNNAIYFSKNGTFQNSGDPTSGSTKTGAISITDPASTIEGGYYFAVGEATSETSTFEANFGNAPYTISSGNSDGSGFGNFEYSVPSNYFALCSKNLGLYG